MEEFFKMEMNSGTLMYTDYCSDKILRKMIEITEKAYKNNTTCKKRFND